MLVNLIYSFYIWPFTKASLLLLMCQVCWAKCWEALYIIQKCPELMGYFPDLDLE